MGMPVETTTVSVDRAENADIQRPFTGGVQQVIDRQTAEVVEQPAVDLKKGPERIGKSEDQVYPVTVRQAVKLGGNPQVSGLFPAGRTGPAVAGIGDIFYMRTAGIIAAIFLTAGNAGTTGEHFGDGFNFNIAQSTGVKEGGPALVGREQSFERTGQKTVRSGEGHPPASPLRWHTNRNGDRSGKTTHSATGTQGKGGKNFPRNTGYRKDYCRRQSQQKQMDMKSYSDGLRPSEPV